jgi:hypothetical protein
MIVEQSNLEQFTPTHPRSYIWMYCLIEIKLVNLAGKCFDKKLSYFRQLEGFVVISGSSQIRQLFDSRRNFEERTEKSGNDP